jgi:arylsulfatase A
MKSTLLPLILSLILCLAAIAPISCGAAEKPNIVYIICDDLGYGDIHCLAPETSKIPTPHTDRLASQGMVFTDAHSGSAAPTTSAAISSMRWCSRRCSDVSL